MLDEATSYIEMLAERSVPIAMQVIKQQVYRHLSTTLGNATRESLDLMRDSLDQPNFREGVMSYVEKRRPRSARVSTPS